MRTLLSLSSILLLPMLALAARPVAHWDEVPDQRIDETLTLGVVAFHKSGVKVEFSIDGKVVHTAEAPELNERTNVWEYVFPFNPASYPDGPLLVHAKAIPLAEGEEAYEMEPFSILANAKKTLDMPDKIWVDSAKGSDKNEGTKASPLQSLAEAVRAVPAGGTVLLAAGEYEANKINDNDRDFWTTIRPAAGVERDQVMIRGGRPSAQRLKFQEVTLFSDAETGKYDPILSGDQGKTVVWLDNVKMLNTKGRYAASTQAFGNGYPAFITGGESTEISNGPGGRLIRDHHITHLTSDAWTGSNRLVVNCSVTDIDRGPTEAHPDFHQSYTRAPDFVENVILYNVRGYDCISQGLFGSRLKNSAFVNVLFDKQEGPMYSQYSGPMENVMFVHVTLPNQSWLWRGQGDDAFTPTDVLVSNNVFVSMQAVHDAKTDGLTVTHNFFSNEAKTMGEDAVTGDAGFADVEGNDFRITESSAAWGKGVPLQCVPADINGTEWGDTPNLGCYAQGAEAP